MAAYLMFQYDRPTDTRNWNVYATVSSEPNKVDPSSLSGHRTGMHETPAFYIAPVRTADDLASAVNLFRAYASSLAVDLSFQNFEAEMETMPGKYAPPTGELLLARSSSGTAVGCVALRPIEPLGCCEMKRLYVSPEGRGSGIGERLVEAIVRDEVARFV